MIKTEQISANGLNLGQSLIQNPLTYIYYL